MKTFVRTLLLILLAAAIILGTAWYLLEYDRDFTHDLLLEGARFFETKDMHEISTWLYDAAYKYGTNIDEISLELANYYQSVGNFAKVEEALTRAIKDGGGAEIYIALSRAFVQQDKILDALKLIESVEDPTIRSQLALLRPAAAVPSTPSGHYNEYLTLTFRADAGSIYVSQTKIPSTQSDLHTGSIFLSTGETTLYSVVVGENGLVSPVTPHQYTIFGTIERVNFEDSAMESAIRKALHIPEGIAVYTNDLWELRSFVIPDDARNYSDLKYLPYLEELSVSNGQDSLAYITELENLKKLTIKDTSVNAETLQSIFQHTGLTSLTLRNCGLTSLLGFEGLTELTYLDLGENVLRNLTPLSNLKKLQELHLDHNAVVGLTALQNLTALKKLDLSYNSIVNLNPLATLHTLQQLNLRSNLITNINAIGRLTTLGYLDLSYNKITSISVLSSCKNLSELLITNNQITSLSPLSQFVKLERLDFSHNNVTILPTWGKNCLLYAIDGSYNKLSSVKPLSGLANLCTVTLDYNASLSDVKALAKCPNLGALSVYGTNVKDVSAFLALEITVYYDPT